MAQESIKFSTTEIIPANPFVDESNAMLMLKRKAIATFSALLERSAYFDQIKNDEFEVLSPTAFQLESDEEAETNGAGEGENLTNIHRALVGKNTEAEINSFLGGAPLDIVTAIDWSSRNADGDLMVSSMDECPEATECWGVDITLSISTSIVREKLKAANLLSSPALDEALSLVPWTSYMATETWETPVVKSFGKVVREAASLSAESLSKTPVISQWVWPVGDDKIPGLPFDSSVGLSDAVAFPTIDSTSDSIQIPPLSVVEVVEQGSSFVENNTTAPQKTRWKCNFYNVGGGVRFTKLDKASDPSLIVTEGLGDNPKELFLVQGTDKPLAIDLWTSVYAPGSWVENIPLSKIGEGWIEPKFLRPMGDALSSGQFAVPPTKNVDVTSLGGTSTPGKTRQYETGVPFAALASGENKAFATYNVVVDIDHDEFAALDGPSVYVDRALAEGEDDGTARQWVNNFADDTVEKAIKIRALGYVLGYYNVALDFNQESTTKRQIASILSILMFGSIKIVEKSLQLLPNAGGSEKTMRRVMVQVPVRFIDALKKWTDTFDYDLDISEDLLKGVGQIAPVRDAIVEALAQVLLESAEPLSSVLSSEDKFEAFAAKVQEAATKKIVEKEIKYKTSFSLAIPYDDIKKRNKYLKQVFKHYDKEIKKSTSAVYIPTAAGDLEFGNPTAEQTLVAELPLPGGPPQAPSIKLDFMSIHAKIETFFENLEGFLVANAIEYKEARWNDGDGADPAAPKASDIVEIGFDETFKVNYILFNGFPMTIGTSIWLGRFNDPKELYWLVNSLIQRFTLIYAKTRSARRPKWDEFVKTNIGGARIAAIGRGEDESEADPDAVTLKTPDEVAEENKKVNDQEKLLEQAIKASKEIDDIRDSFWKELPKIMKTIHTIDDVYNRVMNVVPLDSIINQILACSFPELASGNLQQTIISLIMDQLFDGYQEDKDRIDNIIKEVLETLEAAKDCVLEILQAVYVINGITTTQAQHLSGNLAQGITSDNLGDLTTANLQGQQLGEFSGEVPDFFTDGVGQNVDGVPLYGSLPQYTYEEKNNYIVKLDNSSIRMEASDTAPSAGLLEKGTLVLKMGSVKKYHRIIIKSGTNEGLGEVDPIFIRKTDVSPINFDEYGIIAVLSDLTKIQLSDEAAAVIQYKGNFFRKVRVIDDTKEEMNFGKVGFIQEGLLRPVSEFGKAAANALEREPFLRRQSPMMKDGEAGLISEVTTWQSFLDQQNLSLGSHGVDGEFGDATETATEKFGNTKLGDKNDDPIFTPLKDGIVTIGAFKYYMRLEAINQGIPEGGETLNTIEENLAPVKMTILDNVTYAPPGFYSQKTLAEGPCVNLFLKLYLEQRLFDLYRVKALSKNTSKIKKKEYEQKRDEKKKVVEGLLIEYTQCAQSVGFDVTGNRHTHLYSRGMSDEEIIQQDAYKIVLQKGKCDDKKLALIAALGGTGSTDDTVLWPGRGNATDDQIKAFDEWLDCINNRTTEVAKETVESKAAASEGAKKQQDITAATIAASLPDYPLPTNFFELYDLVMNQGVIPINLDVHPQAGQRFVEVLFGGKSECIEFLEQIAELIIAIIMEEFPEIAEAIRITMETIEVAIQAYQTIRASVEALIAVYEAIALGDMPKFPADAYDKHFKEVMYRTLQEAATDLIKGFISSLMSYLISTCNQEAGLTPDSNTLDQVANDIAAAYAANPNNAKLFNDILAGYNFMVDSGVSNKYNIITTGVSVTDFLSELIGGLTRRQVCMLIGGNPPEYLKKAVVKTLTKAYPDYASIFNDEFLEKIFSAMLSFVGPDYCLSAKADPSAGVSGGFIPCLDNYKDDVMGAALNNTDLTPAEQGAYRRTKIEDAMDVLQKALKVLDDPQSVIDTPDQCALAKEQYLQDDNFLNTVRGSINGALFAVQKSFDTDITNFIPRISNVAELVEDAFSAISQQFSVPADSDPFSEGTFTSGVLKEGGGLTAALAESAHTVAEEAQQSKYAAKIDGFKKAFSPTLVYKILDSSGEEKLRSNGKPADLPTYTVPDPFQDGMDIIAAMARWEEAKRAAHNYIKDNYGVMATGEAYLNFAWLGSKDHLFGGGWLPDVLTLKGQLQQSALIAMYAGASPSQWWQGTLGEDHKIHGLTPAEWLGVQASEPMLEIWHQYVFKEYEDLFDKAEGMLAEDTITDAQFLTFSESWAPWNFHRDWIYVLGVAHVDSGLTPGLMQNLEDDGNPQLFHRLRRVEGIITQRAKAKFGLKVELKEEYLQDGSGLSIVNNTILPSLKSELLGKTIEDVSIVDDGSAYNIDVELDYVLGGSNRPLNNVDVLDYSLLQSHKVSNKFIATIRQTEKKKLDVRGGARMDPAMLSFIEGKLQNENITKFYGLNYISALFKENLADILNVSKAEVPSFSGAATKVFENTIRETIAISLNKTGKSRFFNLNELATLTMAPTLEQINEECQGTQVDLGAGPSKSVLDIDGISDFIMADFAERFDPCDKDGKPYKEALMDGYIISYMRIFLTDHILKGIFAASELPINELLQDKMIVNYLYKQFVEEVTTKKSILIFKTRAFKILELYKKYKNVVIFTNSRESALRRLFQSQIPVVATMFDKLVIKKFNEKALTKEFIYPFMQYTVTNFADRDPRNPSGVLHDPVKETKFVDLFRREPKDIIEMGTSVGQGVPEDTPSLKKFMERRGDGAFFYQKYLKVQLKEGLAQEYRIDDFLGPETKGGVRGKHREYLNLVRSRLVGLRAGGGLEPYYVINPRYLAKVLLKPLSSKHILGLKPSEILFDDEIEELVRECFTFTAGVTFNYGTTREDGVREPGGDSSLTWLKDHIAGAGAKAKHNVLLTDPETGKNYYILPLKRIEKPEIETEEQVISFMTMIEKQPPAPSTLYKMLRKYYSGDISLDIFEYKFELLTRVDTLRRTIEESEEFRALFGEVIPVGRYAAFSFLYTNLTVNNKFDLNNLFDPTKALILHSLQMLMFGKLSQTPQFSNLGETGVTPENISSMDGALEDILMGFLAKALITTPLHVVKGVAEIADPNIAITKKIFDVMDLIVKVSLQVFLMTSNIGYAAAKAAHAQTKRVAAMDPTGETPEPDPMPETFDEWFEQVFGTPPPDPSVGIPWPVAAAVAPGIAFSLMPSAIPFGVGFPPLPAGPGVGPPMTMLAIPYLAFGLIKNGTWTGRPSGETQTLCPDPSNLLNLGEQ